MSSHEASDGRGGGVLGALLAPLRLAGRVMDALDSVARELGPIRSELTRVREQTAALESEDSYLNRAVLEVGRDLATRFGSLHEIAQALESEESNLITSIRELGRHVETRLDSLHGLVEALESEDSYLNGTVRELGRQVATMHDTIIGLQGDVERITERLPDPSRGPLEKARDALTSGDQSSSG